ncbi:SGNH/GDSL hydrolase family protein [Mucilaginibacter gotjawali]|uniref:GDSL-like Lipase/Acylhydrolase n=2 Tax=Mucilaginibacter gotjawali TaxID=1550579 RepID=A0A120MYL4_9SPHI|nr:SGNH/GDSL hydrolase family protein [Mucilaginibacter gotjawali]MBB3057533.1 lysophospholipase L1-like esterase [Mucilaginibacter gotjawali]BAU55346.1 GDSL-like Lipase/Acylhydrolase [Mucilaginibacter gotjawali]
MNFIQNSRRNFIKNAAVGAIAGLAMPEIVAAAIKPGSIKKIKLEKDNVILFQGDSITDWGRSHDAKASNASNTLGSGYVLLTAGHLLLDFAGKNLQIYNKGVSGNKVYQLAERWDSDCLQLKPDVLSIHIGVNDYWHTITNGYTGTIETYIADYHKLINRTKEALPNIKIIICEPFATKGVRAVDDKWYPTFDLFRKAAHDIASEYRFPFVPYQSVFDKALEIAPPTYWSLDGVHPSVAGTALMAKTWMEIVG